MKIDAIAVTNHNMFDKEQFCEICNALSGIMVFPGIEINIGANAGHFLVISERSNLDDFTRKCKQVEAKIPTASFYLLFILDRKFVEKALKCYKNVV